MEGEEALTWHVGGCAVARREACVACQGLCGVVVGGGTFLQVTWPTLTYGLEFVAQVVCGWGTVWPPDTWRALI